MVMKRRILLAVFLLMVIGTVTAQLQNSGLHIVNSPRKTEASIWVPTIQTPSYQIFRVKNYYFLKRTSPQNPLLSSVAPDQGKRESNQRLSLSPSYTFDSKKLNLHRYNSYKTTAADVILEVTNMLLNVAFPNQWRVDL